MGLEERFDRLIDRVTTWFRWQVGLIRGEPQPGARIGYRPSFGTGSLALAALVYQVVSGGLLLIYYEPSVSPTWTLCGQAAGAASSSPAAWCSTYYIVNSVPMGNILLTSHLYGAYVLIFLVLLHLFRGFYAGSYRQPGGHFSWVAGVVLLLLTLGMGFTGYLLAYTQLSLNATQVSIALLRSLPVVGPALSNLLVGDGTPQSLLNRMFALHVVLLPAAIAVLVFLHKRTALFPGAFAAVLKWGLLYVGLLLGFAALWVWPLPPYAGSPVAGTSVTVPPWYFLWVFKLVDFSGVTPEDAMLFVCVLVLFLLFLPWLDRAPRPEPRARPWVVFAGNSLLGVLVLLTAWGDLAPGVPISPTEASLRLAPILVANAIVVGLFYHRYRARQRAADRARETVAGAKSTTTPRDHDQPPTGRPVRASTGFWSRPEGVSLVGLMASFFLLPFGLVLPFVFLLAAFLLNLYDASGARRGSGPARTRVRDPWAFGVAGGIALGCLLGILVATVAL